MAQPGNFTPILLYSSSTSTNVPLAANLTNSANGAELAINIADKNLFFKDSTNAVNTVPIRQSSTSSNGWLSSTDWNTFNSKGAGSVTSVAATVPAFLSIAGSPITTSGTLAITLSGTALPVANGGTGLTTLTAGYILYGNGTSAFSNSSALTFDGTNLITSNNLLIGITSSPGQFNNAVTINAGANNLAGIQFVNNATGTAYNNGASIGLSTQDLVINSCGTGSTIFKRGTGFTESARIFPSGGVSIGNTTDPGATNLSVTGNAIATRFVSTSGNTGSILNATATTIATITSIGLYTITARLVAGAGSPTNYSASATVLFDGSAGRITANNGAILTITLSGSSIQVTQISGGTQPAGISWSILNQYAP